jgi:hypothetical protein
MKQSSTLVIATALLLATNGVALAEQAAITTPDAECDRVFKTKATVGKTMSSEQLARDLNLPVEKVNTCLLLLRSHPPPATPQTER